MDIPKFVRFLKAVRRSSPIASEVELVESRLDNLGSVDDTPNAADHSETVRGYYNLQNEFMTASWDESIHFAPLKSGLSVHEAIIQHQRMMIDKLQLQAGMKVIDVGCGIGGPMRKFAQETQVNIVGINVSDVQLRVAKRMNEEAGLGHLLECVQCDFMDMSSFEDGMFDRAYAIESTCHAGDKEKAFKEIFRVLKPGGLLFGQEMCMTDKFDPNDAEHMDVKRALMRGIALYDIATMSGVAQTLEKVGFQMDEARDNSVQNGSSVPWYLPLTFANPNSGITFWRMPAAQKIWSGLASLAGVFKAVPNSSAKVMGMMATTAQAYVNGGRMGLFTPLYNFLARKPS